MNWQNYYHENGCIIKSNLKIQGNAYQNSNVIIFRNIKINPKIRMEEQKTLNSKSSRE
jgi:NDP-sugar pyrophosphorylase family protein